MFAYFRRLIYALSVKIRRKYQGDFIPEKLTADFTGTKKSLFDIKSESSYNSYLSNGSLVLGLKKSNFIAWVEIPELEYQDHVIDAKIRLDSLGGYASTGIMFRIMSQDSYYLALVSGKGYFRIDVVKDGIPKALIAWTEISDFDGTNIDFKIITYGVYLIFLVNGKWVGETSDDSIISGQLGFALASYETTGDFSETNDYSCKAMLDYFAVDSRTKTVEETYKKWTDDSNINAEQRLRLAETLAVMGKSSKALEQIKRAWKRRDEVIRSVSVSYTEVRTRKELLLAARMAFALEAYSEAEEYIDIILEGWPSSAEGKSAHIEKIKILNELNKFAELKEFMLNSQGVFDKDIDYYTILARCYWELKEYGDSAQAWEEAFRLNGENGVYAANAANALELTGKNEEAVSLFLEAGKIFLKQDNKGELEAMMPRLLSIGEKNWEVRTLAGKWAFSIEDYDHCLDELYNAEKLRRNIKPRPKADPALYYLWGMVLSRKKKIRDAIYLLERAVKLAPDYGLFRFKLTELKLTSGKENIDFAGEFKLALEHIGDDAAAEMAEYAGNLLLNAGDAKNAQYFFDRAHLAATAAGSPQ